MLFDKSKFSTKKEMFKFLIENKEQLITQKKSILKKADGFSFLGNTNIIYNKGIAYKSNELIKNPSDDLGILAVINTTNWFDSHEDVHIKGIWTKSVKENKNPLHVQEHKSSEFSKIISSGNDLKVAIKNTTWKELGYDLSGETQALTYDSIVKKTRNPYMHDQYAKGFVTNHSVGMQYVKLFFCLNDKDYIEDFDNFEKYIENVANKDVVVDNGYFWAVTEAKALEGSAVPMGSNIMTPTLENNKSEPPQGTRRNQEPDKSTPYNKLINNLNKNL